MRHLLVCLLLLSPCASFAQQSASTASDDYSGMYSFLRDGEFVQITLEEKGKVSGFVSRYGDSESDKDTFLDQFFESGNLSANHLSFATKQVHGSWFTFEGTIERGQGKTLDEEAYYVLRGTLTRFTTDVNKNTTRQERRVELKSFPREAGSKP